MHISPAESASDYEAFATLIGAYTAWCRARYAHDQWFVNAAFGHQSLDSELHHLADKYGPPNGLTLLARENGDIVGCGAYLRIGPAICEMKRVFVTDSQKGKGIGRKLCEALIAAARSESYEYMRLDTGNLLTEAIALYHSLGFSLCAPHTQYPDSLMPYLVFMEMPLTRTPSRPSS